MQNLTSHILTSSQGKCCSSYSLAVGLPVEETPDEAQQVALSTKRKKTKTREWSLLTLLLPVRRNGIFKNYIQFSIYSYSQEVKLHN